MIVTHLGSARGGFHKTTSSQKVTFDFAKRMEQLTATTLRSKTSKKRSRLFAARDMKSVRSWRHGSCALA